MSNFTDPIQFVSTEYFNGDRRVYRLTRDLIWEVGELGSENYIYVQKGYLTDLMSIPRIFEGFINTSGKYAAAGALHDKLYDVLDKNRLFADNQLFDAMIALGASRWLAWAVWIVVRLNGGRAFKEKKIYGVTNYKKGV
jgi:hypothetical protein